MDWLLSQIQNGNGSDVPVWFQVGGGLMGSGFALWYAWYSTTKIIPRMQRTHSEQLDKLHAQYSVSIEKREVVFQGIINRLVSEFRADGKESRLAEGARTQLVVEAVNRMTQAFTEMKEEMGSRIHK